MNDPEQPEPSEQPEPLDPRTVVVLLSIVVEGGLIVLALFLGWLTENPPLATLFWSLPHLGAAVAASLRPLGSVRLRPVPPPRPLPPSRLPSPPRPTSPPPPPPLGGGGRRRPRLSGRRRTRPPLRDGGRRAARRYETAAGEPPAAT